jgi:hypothetical protein
MTIVYNILTRLILAFLGVYLTVGVLIFGPVWFIKCIGAAIESIKEK